MTHSFDWIDSSDSTAEMTRLIQVAANTTGVRGLWGVEDAKPTPLKNLSRVPST